MIYDTFVQDPFTPYWLLIALGGTAVILCLLGLSIWAFYSKVKPRKLALYLVVVLGVVGMVALCWNMQKTSDDTNQQNRVIAENNLKQKYGIENVLWEKKSTYPESYDLTEIVIQDQDNNILKYGYKIDRETREPHLLNEQEGSSTPSNDLLLDKTK